MLPLRRSCMCVLLILGWNVMLVFIVDARMIMLKQC